MATINYEKKSISSDILIHLFNSGLKKLVPLGNDGIISMPMTEGDRKKIKAEDNIEVAEICNYWFTFIDEHDGFWNTQKLADPYYTSKFKNVAVITGNCEIDGDVDDNGNGKIKVCHHALDIDSEYVCRKLSSKELLENPQVKEFIQRYTRLISDNYDGTTPESFLDFLKKITYVTKTRKPFGYHVHWFEYSKNPQILLSGCFDERKFEIFTAKHLACLAPSFHREDKDFQYSEVGSPTVQVLDGLYDLLVEILDDCLLKTSTKAGKTLPSTCPAVPSIKPAISTKENVRLVPEVTMVELLETLRPFYKKGFRNNIILSLSGFYCKNKVPQENTIKIVDRLTTETKDEEKDQRIITVLATYKKAEEKGIDDIAGISLLEDILLSQLRQQEKEDKELQETIDTVKEVVRDVVRFFDVTGIDDLLPDSIKTELSSFLYKIIRLDPIGLVVSHTEYRKLLSASVHYKEIKNKENCKTYKIPYLQFDSVILDCIPSQIIIYDNPIDKTRKYEITFLASDGKKNFCLGPLSLDNILSDLQLRNKVIKKSWAHDALSAIISAFEETGKAIINDTITTPGYYIIDGRFTANETNQLPIAIGPSLTVSDNCTNGLKSKESERVDSCIQLLESLEKKWKKGVFSTVIKWAVVSPFSFILKQNNKLFPYLYLYGWSSAGKTTLGRITLAVWGKYPSEKNTF